MGFLLALLFQVGVALAKKDKAGDLSLSQIHFQPVIFWTPIWLARFARINLLKFQMYAQFIFTNNISCQKVGIFYFQYLLFQEHGQ